MEKIHQIEINLLFYRRPVALPIHAYFLSKIKEENKKKIQLNILGQNGNWPDCEPICEFLRTNGIDAYYNFQFGNYIDKIKFAANTPSPHCVKLDEDCFVSNHVWDFMLDNVNLLDNEDNLLLAPCLTTGIPTHDYVCEDMFSLEQNAILDEMKRQSKFKNIWGVDYTFLDQQTINSDRWRPNDFYNLVKTLQHDYKGIHPIRLHSEIVKKTNEYFLENFEKFVNKTNLYVQSIDYNTRPYFCNSFFIIRTDVWRSIINDRSLYVDPYDEVPLNRYRVRYNKKFLFIRNSNGVHTLYGCNEPYEPGIEIGLIRDIKNRLGIKWALCNY